MAIEYEAGLITVDAAQLAGWRGSASASALNLDGPCPRCGHDSPNQVPRQITSLERPAVASRPGVTTQLACTCTEDHPGRPAGVTTGCGRTWFVLATTEAYGTVALAPLAAPPVPAVAAAAQALRAAGSAQ